MNFNPLFRRFSSEDLSEPEIAVSERWEHALREKFAEVSYDEFMKQFLPQPPPLPDVARPRYRSAFMGMPRVVHGVREDRYLECFNMCLQRHRLFPGFSFVLAHDVLNEEARSDAMQDDDEKVQPFVDAALFLERVAPSDETTWWAHQTMSFMFVAPQTDPFEDGIFNSRCLRYRRQLVASIERVFSYQHRSSFFNVLVIGNCARLLRWDRCGALFTEKFNFRQNPELLGDFLWRFSQTSEDQQGRDTSATAVGKNTADYKLMKKLASEPLETGDYVRQYFARSLDESWPWWRIRIDTEEMTIDADGEIKGETSWRPQEPSDSKFFLVGKPHFQAPGLAGRGSRGYIGVDCATKKFIYLKDVWRFELPGAEREGDVLHRLNVQEVVNVPTLICHGDVLGQCTVTHDVWNLYNMEDGKRPIKKQSHYRIVVAEVGRPLRDFRRGLELVLIIYDCLRAHRQAYEKCHLLHQDVSTGNILIVERLMTGGDGKESLEWGGLLNDWELSMLEATDYAEETKECEHLGTWEFLSARSLQHTFGGIRLPDELESFFHVLLYMSIRYLPHNCSDVPSFIQSYFTQYNVCHGRRTGGDSKMCTIRLANFSWHGPNDLRFGRADSEQDYPMNGLLHELLSWFQAHYCMIEHDRAEALRENPPVLAEDQRHGSGIVNASATSDSPSGASQSSNSELQVLEDRGPRIEDEVLRQVSDDSDDPDDEELLKEAERKAQAQAFEEMKLESYKVVAKNLQSHHAIAKLFLKYIRMRWPAEDKYAHPLVSINEQGSSSSTTTSRKRVSDGEMPSSKRLKSSGSQHSDI